MSSESVPAPEGRGNGRKSPPAMSRTPHPRWGNAGRALASADARKSPSAAVVPQQSRRPRTPPVTPGAPKRSEKPAVPYQPDPKLLDDLDAFVRSRMDLSPAQQTVVCLWIAHTYIFDHSNYTPKLFITSPVPESARRSCCCVSRRSRETASSGRAPPRRVRSAASSTSSGRLRSVSISSTVWTLRNASISTHCAMASRSAPFRRCRRWAVTATTRRSHSSSGFPGARDDRRVTGRGASVPLHHDPNDARRAGAAAGIVRGAACVAGGQEE